MHRRANSKLILTGVLRVPRRDQAGQRTALSTRRVTFDKACPRGAIMAIAPLAAGIRSPLQFLPSNRDSRTSFSAARPSLGGGFWFTWIIFLSYLFLAHFTIGAGKSDGWLFFYAGVGVTLIPVLVAAYLYNFEVRRWSDSDFSPYASSDD